MPNPTTKPRPRKRAQTAVRKGAPAGATAKAESPRTAAALSPKTHGAARSRGAATANSANVSSNVARTPNAPVPNKAGYQEENPTTDAMKRDREARANETLTQRARTSEENNSNHDPSAGTSVESSQDQGPGPAFLEPRKTEKR